MMSRETRIPIHRLDDVFSGFYIAPLGGGKSSKAGYEMSRPHRHDFYYCVLLEKGGLELEVDFEKVLVRDGEFYLSYPGQIHQVNSSQPDRGWYVAFSPAFIEEPLRDVLDQTLSEVILVPLSTQQILSLSAGLSLLHEAYTDSTQVFRERIIRAMLSAFIYQAASAYSSMECVTLVRHSARAIDISKRFKQLLRRNFKLMKKPSRFAAEMSLTPTYLNDTVRSVTGFSVTYHIQHELMREAQRLLSQPGMTVKEAARILDFDDDKYFNRLFSKMVGVSPGMFRKRLEHLSLHS